MKKIFFYLITLFLSFKCLAQFDVIGSSNYGRIIDITYHPTIQNKLYAATGGNHIVTSNNNGQTWELFYSYPIKDVFIQNLKIFDSNSLIFTVDSGYGTWNDLYVLNTNTALIVDTYTVPLTATADESEITSYEISKLNSDIAIVQQIYSIQGSRFGKVYYTTNHGLNWDEIYYTENYDAIFPNSVAIHPTDPTKLFISRIGGNNPTDWGGLFISDDSGVTWQEKLSGIDFGPIAFKPDNPNEILLGTTLGSLEQNLYKSNDGGENWTVIDENWADIMPNGVFTIKYSPVDFNKILVLGLNERVNTQDNFATHQAFQVPNEIENENNYYFGSNATINPFQDNQVFITNNDYPLFTSNFGETVSKVNNPFFYSQIGQLNLFKSNGSKHLYYSVQNGYGHKNLNTQVEASYGLLPLQVSPFTNNKFYSDDYIEGRVYGYYTSNSFSGSGLGVFNNHGAISYVGIPSPNNFLHAITSNPNDENLLLCSLSDDFANSSLIQFNISDPNNVQQTTITLPEQGLLRDFHFDIVNPNQMWIAIGKNIYKTNDNGTTWVLHNDGLDELNFNDRIYQITQNPLLTNQLTIATSKGIFTSVNNGDNWSHLTIVDEVQNIKHSDINTNHIVAISYNNEFSTFSLRYSVDSGTTWEQVSSQDLFYINSDNNSAAIEFINNSAVVYIGTYDLGVISYTIDLSALSNPIFELEDNYRLFPNPTQNILNIQAKETVKEIYVYDLSGKKVKVNQLSTNTIDVSNLAQGMYIIKMIMGHNKTFTGKIIKK